MEDTDTKNVSLALYRYVCQNIVGNKNHVNTIRKLNTVRDNMMSTKLVTSITSGSFGEGLSMRGSDLDVMEVLLFLEVYADDKTQFQRNKEYFRMETEDVKTGFTQLLSESNDLNFLRYCETLNGKYYLSSKFLKQYILGKSNTLTIHGPCLSSTNGSVDQCFCLHSKTWISQASPWISRSNNSWPSYNVKQSIIKHGVLFVPIGVKGSPKEDIEWRISFSVGEKMLISTFTHTQLVCYALLKILLKDVIEIDTECRDLLCSYFVKTIVFWISEELPQSEWRPDNLIPCFMRCFSRLIYCVKYSACLHYFIPENNMFENKIEGRAREILLNELFILHRYGWRCVLFSNQLFNLHLSVSMDHIEPHTLPTIEVASTLSSKLLFMSNALDVVDPENETYVYKSRIHQLVSCVHSSLKFLNTYYMSLWCAKYAQAIPLNSRRSSNRHRYKQYKFCLSTLLQNIHHDAMSGWLLVASFSIKRNNTIKRYTSLCILYRNMIMKNCAGSWRCRISISNCSD